MFNTVLYNTREAFPFILFSVSLEPEAVHLQTEDTKQDIQDPTSDYLFNTSIPNNNILDVDDDTIKYSKEFLQPRHSYPEPPTTPNSQFYSLTTQDHLTPDIRA